MSEAIIIVQWLLLTTSILLVLKLTEMFIGFVAIIRGRPYSRELTLLIRKWEKSKFDASDLDGVRHKHRWFLSQTDFPFTKQFLRLPRPIRELFRYRWLVLIQILAVLTSTNRVILWTTIILLLAAVWIGIMCLVADRLVFGYADSYFRKMYANLSTNVENYDYALTQTHQERVQDFFAVFVWMVTVLISAYAAIYDGLDRLAGEKGAFQNIPHDWTRSLHLLYFSVVTVATVGYGDISPRIDSLIARLMTGSEILAGFMLLTVLVLSASMTIERE